MSGRGLTAKEAYLYRSAICGRARLTAALLTTPEGGGTRRPNLDIADLLAPACMRTCDAQAMEAHDTFLSKLQDSGPTLLQCFCAVVHHQGRGLAVSEVTAYPVASRTHAVDGHAATE